jgi:hypothetical protein
MRDAVFGNVGTIMSFKIGAEDAEYMAKEFAPVLSEQDVIGIPNFNCYTKLNINNTTSRPFSLATIYDESERNEKLGGLIKEYSRMKYGHHTPRASALSSKSMASYNRPSVASSSGTGFTVLLHSI